jgi:hypothetical protein
LPPVVDLSLLICLASQIPGTKLSSIGPVNRQKTKAVIRTVRRADNLVSPKQSKEMVLMYNNHGSPICFEEQSRFAYKYHRSFHETCRFFDFLGIT